MNSSPSPEPLKITLISHSDILGGASIVTYRLMYALRDAGVDARMVVFNSYTDDTLVTQAAQRLRRGITFIGERAGIALNNGFSRANLFKVSTAATGLPLWKHPWVREADVIMLGWINQGLLSLRGIRRLSALGKPIIWTMHDMWCMTGICHHAGECDRYHLHCGDCPFLAGHSDHDLSYRVWKRKQRLYDAAGITFVAVSNWLAELAEKSSLLSGRDVRVIPNAFPVDSFFTTPTRSLSILGSYPHYIVMGAARLDDPIKGLPMAIEALNMLFDNRPDVANGTMVIFFGDLADRSALDSLRFPHIHMGTINDARTLRQLFANADVVLSTSLYETLPTTLIEGLASGALAVTFGAGGQADIVDHLRNGYIARYKDTADIAKGIVWALEKNQDRNELHEDIRRRFSSATVAQRYISLCHELLNR